MRETPPDNRELADVTKRLERLLFENIVPAWYPGSIDRIWNGYRLDRDVSGNKLRRTNKMIVTQTRMIWFFSRLARFVPDEAVYVKAAETGVRFINSRMRDKTNGGYNIEVWPSGLRVTNSCKHLYCQTISLMALSEYARISGDEDAISSVTSLFQTIEDHSYDKTLPGYRETFLTDWEVLPKNEMGFMWLASDWKTLNTHMHLIEAYTTYLSVFDEPLAVERISEVLEIIRTLAMRTESGALGDVFKIDWKPQTDAQFKRVSYGHNIELIWLFIDACEKIGQSPDADIPWFERVFDYALRYGFDEAQGGFFDSGPINRKADKLDKIWWVQAEACVSTLTMYRLTKRKKYWNCFLNTLSWIEGFQADWERGDWHYSITTAGYPRGPKASPWKAAYHNGRAMIECLERLPERDQLETKP